MVRILVLLALIALMALAFFMVTNRDPQPVWKAVGPIELKVCASGACDGNFLVRKCPEGVTRVLLISKRGGDRYSITPGKAEVMLETKEWRRVRLDDAFYNDFAVDYARQYAEDAPLIPCDRL